METPRYLSVRHWNLLRLLEVGEFTAHDIRDRYRAASDGRTISYGSVYVEMYRLTEKGLVNFLDKKDEIRNRRLFSLTDLGQTTLHDAPLVESTDGCANTRPPDHNV